jgi:hypothetical protein
MLPKLKPFLEEAIEFMKELYPTVDFDGINIFFSYIRTNSVFTYKKTSSTYNKITIGITYLFHLYERQGAELKTPMGGLCVGYDIAIPSQIIHELTHYVQFLEKRRFSEVETTRNEIAFLKKKDSYWYSQLIPVK